MEIEWENVVTHLSNKFSPGKIIDSKMTPRRVTRSQTKASPEKTQLTTASNDRDTYREMALNVKSSEKITKPSKTTKSAKKSKSTSTKKTDKSDAFKPKKPPTAFFYFLEDFRKEFQEKNPDVKSMRDVGKACGERWKTMTYEEKVNYYDIATQSVRNLIKQWLITSKENKAGVPRV